MERLGNGEADADVTRQQLCCRTHRMTSRSNEVTKAVLLVADRIAIRESVEIKRSSGHEVGSSAHHRRSREPKTSREYEGGPFTHMLRIDVVGVVDLAPWSGWYCGMR